MSLPNYLTVLRIALTIGFLALIQQDSLVMTILAGILFVVAALTDYYDGYYAKKLNKITSTGKILDPIADKFLILSAFFVFTRMRIVMPWMFVLIAIREVLVTTFRFFSIAKGQVLAAELAGKMKTVLQMTSAIVIILFLVWRQLDIFAPWDNIARQNFDAAWQWLINVLMILAVIMTLYSGIIYIWNNRQALRNVSRPAAKDPS